MPEFDWFKPLTEDSTDPSTPLFWETVYWLAKQGKDLSPPKVAKPDTNWDVKATEIKREIAILTPTQMLPVVEAT